MSSDPRLSGVAVDDRFKSVFEDDKKKGKKGKAAPRVAETKETDGFTRFYRPDEADLAPPGGSRL